MDVSDENLEGKGNSRVNRKSNVNLSCKRENIMASAPTKSRTSFEL